MDEPFFTGFSHFLFQWKWPLIGALSIAFSFHLSHVPAGRRLYTTAMSLYFFLVIISYWILKPLKKATFIGYYKSNSNALGLEPAQMELLAKELNVAVALLAALGLIWLRRRFASSGYATAVTLLFALGLAILIPAAAQPGEKFAWGFYLFGDVYVSSLVALFFATLHDHTSVTDSRRIYGLIGLGGVLGGVIGSLAAGELGKTVGLSGALLSSLMLTLCVTLVAWYAVRSAASRPYNADHVSPEPSDSRSLFHGAHIVRQSHALMLIAGVLLTYEIASVLLDYQFTAMVSRLVPTAELKNYFSAVYSFSNAMAIVVQLILTTWMLKRFGVGLALFVMPVAIAAASGAFLIVPMLLTASLLNTADGAFAYSIQQTARESLYVPLGRHEKYEAKAFLDIVWLRFAKGLAVLLSLVLSLLIPVGEEIWITWVVMLIVLVWVAMLRKILPEVEPASAPRPQAALL